MGKLGKDYALGCVTKDNLDSIIMRIIPDDSSYPGGAQALRDFMSEKDIAKFRLVPVGEFGSHLEALKAAVKQEEARLARHPICDCGQLSYDLHKEETMCAFCRDEAS